MKGITTGFLLVLVLLFASEAKGARPYVQFEVGVASRDVVEEGEDIVSFKFEGDADTTRLLAKIGLEAWGLIDLYFQGGAVDLSIDEFDGFNSDLSGAYGGGIRFNLYRSPYPDQFTLFIEGNTLRFTAEDRIQAEQLCNVSSGCTVAPGEFLPRLADEEISWVEYVGLIGASGRSDIMGFYGGIRLSVVDGEDQIRGKPDQNFSEPLVSDLDLEEDDIFGLFFGVEFFLDRAAKTVIDIGVTLFDQDSFKVGVRREF